MEKQKIAAYSSSGPCWVCSEQCRDCPSLSDGTCSGYAPECIEEEKNRFVLTGSRARGTATPTSDWDVVVRGIWTARYSEKYDAPIWDAFLEDIDLEALRAEARKAFSIPENAPLDLFFTSYCPECKWPWGVIVVINGTDYGHTVVLDTKPDWIY